MNTEHSTPVDEVPDRQLLSSLFDEALSLVDTLDPDEMTSVVPNEDDVEELDDLLEYDEEAVLAFGPDPVDDGTGQVQDELEDVLSLDDGSDRPVVRDLPDLVATETPAPPRQVTWTPKPDYVHSEAKDLFYDEHQIDDPPTAVPPVPTDRLADKAPAIPYSLIGITVGAIVALGILWGVLFVLGAFLG